MRKRTLAAVAAAGLLAGCASPGPGPTAEPVVDTPAPTPVVSESPSGGAVTDALAITGARFAADVPEMTPVTTRAEPVLPVTLTDATGAQVTVTSADRILAFDLYGTVTDTVIGLGVADRLVGRSISDTHELLAELPVVTYGSHDLNIEAVLDLDPDLILTNGTIGAPEVYGQLESAGVTVVHFEHIPRLDAIGEAITQIGATLGLPEAAADLASQVDGELAAALETIEELRAQTPRAPRGVVLYVRGTAGVFFILGKEYGASDILTAVGLDDVATASGITNLKPANAEALVSLDPELILAMEHGVESAGGVEGILARPGLAATTAGMNERLVIAGDNQLLAYGPRTPANLLALSEAIYGADAH